MGTHFYGLPLSVNIARPESFDIKKVVGTTSGTFAISLSWYLLGNNDLWEPVADSPRHFPTWTWASIKAEQHPKDPGITHSTDYRLGLDYYAELEELQRDYEDFAPTILIKAWTVTCQLHKPDPEVDSSHTPQPFSPWILNKDHVYPDYPKCKPRGELMGVFLGAAKYSGSASPACLIVEKTDASIYRRIGLISFNSVKLAEGDGVFEVLQKMRIEGGWKLRTLEIV
ncbi:hypothetical protein EK21DRAFT_117908 [Setomelanomma holmii]|uniref:Uncharacterized protein n=1 Tax=Setomelanomma holmii TaxID=210430 RepID=A0A9P4GWM2_9PLEO|nr:hypothetical protein EK21DRAFT_117908 [Setomelanomma holmii]